MVPRSLPSHPVQVRTDSTAPGHPPSTTPAELLERLNRLTEKGDEAGIYGLLMSHPKAFAQDMPGWWCIRPGHGLDLQQLFSRLSPAVQLPPLRLEDFEWGPATVCTAALCHPGLKALNLHRCLLTPEAWAQAAQAAEQAFGHEPAALQRLAITADEPRNEDLVHQSLVSSEPMARWLGQCRQLQDLTLAGFLGGAHNHHMSYSHVFMAAKGLPLKRLALEGFMPRAFASPRTGPALQQLIHPDGRPICLSLKGWRWVSGVHDRRQSIAEPVNAEAEQALQAVFRTGSSHLTIELIDMQHAERINALAICAVPARQADVSLRLSCPEDPQQQHTMPLHTRGIDLQPLQGRHRAECSALRGLHVQFDDASTFDTEVALALPRCSRLETLTVAIRAVPGGFGDCARRIDAELSQALAAVPSLRSLELRSDHELQHLPRLREQLLARDLPRV